MRQPWLLTQFNHVEAAAIRTRWLSFDFSDDSLEDQVVEIDFSQYSDNFTIPRPTSTFCYGVSEDDSRIEIDKKLIDPEGFELKEEGRFFNP